MDAEVKQGIVDYYKQYFYTTSANTDELKDQAYRLRNKTYNSYYGIELEKDEFDDYSRHCLLFHKESKLLIGCSRLIPYLEYSEINLPIQLYCEDAIKIACDSANVLNPKFLGELSRFTLSPDFRRRNLNQKNSEGVERRQVNQHFLLTCLTLASINLLFEHKIELALALMEDRLAVVLKKTGVSLEKIGEPINLYGKRTPFIINPDASYLNFSPEHQALFKIIQEEYNKSLLLEK